MLLYSEVSTSATKSLLSLGFLDQKWCIWDAYWLPVTWLEGLWSSFMSL